jgi:hypothetical protein
LINGESSKEQHVIDKFRNQIKEEISSFTGYAVEVDFSLKTDNPFLPQDEEVGYCVYFFGKKDKYEYKGRIEYVSVIYRRKNREFLKTYIVTIIREAIGRDGPAKKFVIEVIRAARYLKARIIAVNGSGNIILYADPGDRYGTIRERYGKTYKMELLAPERAEKYFDRAVKTNPCVSVYGIGPYMTTCGTCLWLEPKGGESSFRCHRWDNAIHQPEWPSCREYAGNTSD